MTLLSLYSDGSSSGKSNLPIGYGWVLVCGNVVVSFGYDGMSSGSNNQAELLGAIEGMRFIASNPIWVKAIKDGILTLEWISDSLYALNLGNGLFVPTKNVELVNELVQLREALGASTRWIRGHSGDPGNERCDRLAKLGRTMYGVDNDS